MQKSMEYGAEPFFAQMGLDMAGGSGDEGVRGAEKDGQVQLKFDLVMLLKKAQQNLPANVKGVAAKKQRSLGGRRGADASDQELRNNQEIMALLDRVRGDLAAKTSDGNLKEAQARRHNSALGGRRGADSDSGSSTKTLLKQDLMILMLKAQKQLPEDLTKYGVKRKSAVAGRRGADPTEMKDVSGFLGWW